MATSILVRFIIPIGDDPWLGPHVYFSRWHPSGIDEALHRHDEYDVRLWLDRECVAKSVDDEDVSRWLNVPIAKVYVDVSAHVTDDLAEFIHAERESPREVHHGLQPGVPGYAGLASQYRELGEKVLQLALTTYNRLIAFVRNTKGQYWLHERPFNSNALTNTNNQFRAQVSIDGQDWIRWCPPSVDSFTVEVSSQSTEIERDDWGVLQEFVASNRKPNLVHELLANSELLLAEGRRRSAVIEAVSALEVEISKFAQSPDTDVFLGADLRERMDIGQLHAQVSHLGLRGTVRYLFPVLFPPAHFPTDLLRQCQDAIEVRNTVIHRGQRDVNIEDARRFVAAVRTACEVLASSTTRA